MVQEELGPASVACPIEAHSASALSPSLPALDFPADVVVPEPIVVRSEHCSLSAHACAQLVDQARSLASQFPDDAVVLGFDCEWVASWRSRQDGKVAVIQLSCVDGTTMIFHVKSRACRSCEAGIMPKALKELIEDEEIQLVSRFGVFMKGRPSSVYSLLLVQQSILPGCVFRAPGVFFQQHAGLVLHLLERPASTPPPKGMLRTPPLL